MFEHDVSVNRIRNILETGEVIEDYSDETAESSRLILGYQGNRPIHVVVSETSKTNELVIITVYSPDPDKWKKDNRSRK
jgi:uncharacterized DUF497 family protein